MLLLWRVNLFKWFSRTSMLPKGDRAAVKRVDSMHTALENALLLG